MYPVNRPLPPPVPRDVGEPKPAGTPLIQEEKANERVSNSNASHPSNIAARFISEEMPGGKRVDKAEKTGKQPSETTATASSRDEDRTDDGERLMAIVSDLKRQTQGSATPVAMRGTLLAQQIGILYGGELAALNRSLDGLSSAERQDPAMAHATVSVKATILNNHVRSSPLLSKALDPDAEPDMRALNARDLSAFVHLQQEAMKLNTPMNFSSLNLSETGEPPTGVIPGTTTFTFETLERMEALGKAAKEELLDREYARDEDAIRALQTMSVRDDE